MLYLELFCKYNTLIQILDYSAIKNFVVYQALRKLRARIGVRLCGATVVQME